MTDPARATGPDGLAPPTPERRPRWLLALVAVAETVTLAVLLVNLPAAHHDAGLAQLVGPIHGVLYTTGIVLTWSARYDRRTKALALLPVLGAWIALAATPSAGRAGGRRRRSTDAARNRPRPP